MEAILDKLSTVALSERRVRAFRDRLKMPRREVRRPHYQLWRRTIQAAVNRAVSYYTTRRRMRCNHASEAGRREGRGGLVERREEKEEERTSEMERSCRPRIAKGMPR
jgi:hypothetical protein